MKSVLFSDEWWRHFIDDWNASSEKAVHSALGAVNIVIDTQSLCLRFADDGLCSLDSVSLTAHTFKGTTANWVSVLSGEIPVQRAVIAGDIQYDGTVKYLTTNMASLEKIVAVAGDVFRQANAPVFKLTDAMLYIQDPETTALRLAKLGGLTIENHGEWISLFHPGSMQRIVLTKEPLPYSGISLGCAVPQLEGALRSLREEFGSESITVEKREGYANVRIGDSLSMLLYQE